VNYNELTRRHFEAAAHAGVLTGPGIRRGAAGSRAQGAWVQFDVQIDLAADLPTDLRADLRADLREDRQPDSWLTATEDGRVVAGLVRAVRFLAFGCPHVIAVSDWVAERSAGAAARRQLPESPAALKARFAVPTEKLGRLLVIEDAWIAALSPPYP
jgi:hypothetical protein